MKVNFYLLSMWLFYIIVIVLSLPLFWKDVDICIVSMILPCLALITLLYVTGFFLFLTVKRKKDSPHLSVKITEIVPREYETLAFLASYFIPLVSFNLDKIRHQIVLVVLFVAIGIIYIRGNMYFANPTLSLLGFKSYTASIQFQDNSVLDDVILISSESLSSGKNVTYYKIDDKVYYAKIL